MPGSANSGRFQYTGQAWLPEIGLYYYKARIYSPTLGRFLQTDPIGYKDQINLYAYVGNDPVDETDPTGLTVSMPAECLFADICVTGRRTPPPDTSLQFAAINRPADTGAPQQKTQPAPRSACAVATNEPGKILYAGATGTLAAWLGLTGAVGRFTNLRTGTTGYYTTAGGGAGFEAAAGAAGGIAPSMSQFLGVSVNVSGALPGIEGSVSANGSGVGASVGTAYGAGATASATYTFVFGCSLGGTGGN